MKKRWFKSTICDRIIGASLCRLGKDNKNEVEVWGCYSNSCLYYLCYACLKINKYLNIIGNLRLSKEVKLRFLDFEVSADKSTQFKMERKSMDEMFKTSMQESLSNNFEQKLRIFISTNKSELQ